MIYLLAYYISGYIYGEDGKPLEAATVILKRLPDSSNAGGTYSEKDGFFKIINVQPGRYVLIIKFVGYEDFSRVVEVSDRDVDLGRIVLKEKAIRVEEVEVKAEAPKITYEEGKRVIRFTDEIVSKGGNALEALKNVPGITVDNNDNIKIRNSENITLYINGRPTILSPSEALRQIPASSIEKIEIITNPSAKYEAEGNVIMNIVLKQSQDRGFSASLMGRLGTYDNLGLNASTGINTGKTKIVLSANYFSFKRIMESEIKAEHPIAYESDGERYFNMKPTGIRGSVEHRLTNNDIANIEVDFGRWNFLMGWLMNYPSYKSDMDVNMGGFRGSLSVGYVKKFLKNHKVEGMVFYAKRMGKENTESYFGDSLGFKRTSDISGNRWRFKLDYSWDIGDKRRFEMGYQWDINENSDSLVFYDYKNGSFILDTTGNYSMNDVINAGYFMYSNALGIFSYQLGLRVEYDDRVINDGNREYPFKSTDLFPSLSLSFNPDIMNSYSITYSRRISRPMGWMLVPFPRQIDNLNYQRGNPNLKPEYTHSFEAGYQRMFRLGNIQIEGFYKRSENKMDFYPYYDTSLRSIVYTWENTGIATLSGAEIFVSLQPFKLLKLDFTVDVYDYRVYYKGFSRSLAYDLKGNLSVGYGPMGLQISGRYNSPRVSARGKVLGSYAFDMGLRLPITRNIFFIAQFDDFMKLDKEVSEIKDENLKMTTTTLRKWPSISVMLFFDYNNFRKMQQREKREPLEEEVPMF
ncbi:MAG: outer membrane beta-barrel family protein [candidate division WOR-3 bacterium]